MRCNSLNVRTLGSKVNICMKKNELSDEIPSSE